MIISIDAEKAFDKISNQRRKRNKRNQDQKRKSKALTVCRSHDTIQRKL